MNNVYKIDISSTDYDTGLDAISLVEFPAVEINFLTFSKETQKNLTRIKFEDNEKHIITGVAILADTPIYRIDEYGNEYYVVFEKKVIEQLVEKYFRHNLTNIVNIEHKSNEYVPGLTMIESIIVNKERGICPVEFSDVPDGSWIVSFKVSNLDVWEKIKTGEVKGFSVQGLFNIIDHPNIENNNYKKNIFSKKMSKLKDALRTLLMKYSDLQTDKGKLEWEEDEQLEVGYAVYIDDLPAPDGEYATGDKVFVVKDGKVEEIKDLTVEDMAKKTKQKCADESTVEEPVEEPVEGEIQTKVKGLETKIAELETKIAELEAKITSIEMTPATNPIVEEFDNVKLNKNIQDEKLKRAIAIASSFKK